MTVEEYDSLRTFLTEQEAVMLEHEALCQLILSHTRQSTGIEQVNQDISGAVLDGETVKLLFCFERSDALIIYTADPENKGEAATALAVFFGSRNTIINGVTADKEVSTAFLEQYQKQVDCTYTEKVGLDIMELRKVNDIKPSEGTQRMAAIEETKLIAEWMIDYRLEAFTSEMDYEAAVEKASEYIKEGKVFVLENDEKLIVTMAVTEYRLVHGMVITYVFTPEEYRGKGYAAANIYYLSRELLNQGYEFCSLRVDKKNTLSSRTYEKVGYVILGEIYEYKILHNK